MVIFVSEMTMKRNITYLSSLLSAFLVLLAGCEKSDVDIVQNGTADVTLVLALDGTPADFEVSESSGRTAMSSSFTKASSPEVLPSEGLRTLRVIVTQGTPGNPGFNIVYNEKITDAGSSSAAPVSVKPLLLYKFSAWILSLLQVKVTRFEEPKGLALI